jgi:signal transduction histidine kinase
MDLARLWAGAFVAYGLAASLTIGVAASVAWHTGRKRVAWLVPGALLALAVHYVGMGIDAALHASSSAAGPLTVWTAIGQTGATVSFETLLFFLLSVVTQLFGTRVLDRWTRRLVLMQVVGGSALALILLTLIVRDDLVGTSFDNLQSRIASLVYGDGGLPIVLLAIGPTALFRVLSARLPIPEASVWTRWVGGNSLSPPPTTSNGQFSRGDWFPADHFRALTGIYGMGLILIGLRFTSRAAVTLPSLSVVVVGLRLLFVPSAFAVLYYAARPVFFEAVLKHGLLFAGIGGAFSIAGGVAAVTIPALSPLAIASAVLGASVIVYLVGISVHAATEWLDERIFRRPDYARHLNDLLVAMASSPHMPDLQTTVAAHTAEALGAVWARLAPQVPSESAIAIGIGTPAHRRGFLVVGPRHRGHSYSAADVAFVEAVSAHYLSVLEASHARHAQRIATVAELRALRAQINPHFLFNALTALAEKVRSEPAAERLVLNLAELFRFALDSTQHDTVPLRTELAAIEAYLQIERERFGDLLRWTIDVPDELRDMPIPPMVLQPLVENSIRHGLAVSPHGGTVTVAAVRVTSGVRLTVADDGAGFVPGVAPERVGLANVRARVEHAGGTWHLHAAPGAGTVISMEVGLR